MYRRTPLLRMIILVTFIILVLIIFITHKSNKDNIAENPNYREIFFWQDENKAYSLLLHSVTIDDRLFSAYSSKWDTLMTFSAQHKDLKSIKNKFDNSSYKIQECTNCHHAN